jgi:hypothetical protein
VFVQDDVVVRERSLGEPKPLFRTRMRALVPGCGGDEDPNLVRIEPPARRVE